METRLTLRPGQSGTKKLLARYGERLVRVRIAFHETDLRERAKRLGAIWRPAQKLWELTWADAKRLDVSDRVAGG